MTKTSTKKAPTTFLSQFGSQQPPSKKKIPTNPIPDKGHVVIVNVYEGSYWNIYVDGKLVDQTYKELYDASVLRRNNRRQWAKDVGVVEDDLRYTCYDLFHGLSDATMADFDANGYEAYTDVMNLIAAEKIAPDYVAQDLDFVEAYI